jgi:hypothetical protein
MDVLDKSQDGDTQRSLHVRGMEAQIQLIPALDHGIKYVRLTFHAL